MKTERLERNISDMALEGFLKIGFMADQPVRIYYFGDLLAELLELEDEESLDEALELFCAKVAPRLGEVRFTPAKERYECFISAQGAGYIYENNGRRKFLGELIRRLSAGHCTIEDILPIFRKESEQIILEETDGEFQYVISFADTSIDEFRYCFTFDEMGSYYHRLLPYDYERL